MTALPTSRQTRRNVVSIWANRILAVAAPLVVTPIITHAFGLELTGVWLLATQLAAHLMLLDVGFANSLIRHLARLRIIGDTAAASQYLSTAIYALGAVGLALLLLSPWLVDAFLVFFAVAPAHQGATRSLVLLTFAFVGLSLPLRVGYALLSSAHRFDLIQLWEALGILLRLLLIIALFRWAAPTIFDLGLVVFGTTLLASIIIMLQGLRADTRASIAPQYVSRTALTGLASMGGAALNITLAQVLLMQGSSMIAGRALGPAAVPLIAYPLMIFVSLTPFFQTFPAIMAPIAATHAARGEHAELYGRFIGLSRYLASSSLLLALGLAAGGYAVLTLWLAGPELTAGEIGTMAVSLGVIFIGYAIAIVAPLARAILTSVGLHWQTAIADITSAVVGLAAGYVLMMATPLGTIGMAAGVALALMLRGLIWFPLLIARFFHRSPLSIIAMVLGRPLIAAALFVGTAAALRVVTGVPVEGITDIFQLIGFYLLPLLAWLAATWLLVVTPEHRQAIATRIRQLAGG